MNFSSKTFTHLMKLDYRWDIVKIIQSVLLDHKNATFFFVSIYGITINEGQVFGIKSPFFVIIELYNHR